MKTTLLLLPSVFFVILINTSVHAREMSEVSIIRTPHDGLQPLAQVDANGVLHLVYFKGEAAHGDLFYVQRAKDGAAFSDPVRINHIDGAAMAIGTIRGAHFALGRDRHLHIAWMGSKNTMTDDDHHRAPMLYTRSLDGGKTFKKERNLIEDAYGLDGGGSLAADMDTPFEQ